MASSTAIEVSRVSKIYRRFSHRKQFATLKSALLSRSLIKNLRPDETFTALNDVSLTVPKGRTLGVIGRNGSGKSTLLKLVAGITKPSTGTVKVDGRISALIELGAGFHPEISGRENVFINGIMLGLTKREVTQRFDEIVEFAEMKEFIDAPVKTYSSGMYMRLGFAVAIHVDPEVLLVDEVLAVGDEGFTHKCLDKFAEFKRRGKTILLVTHSLGHGGAVLRRGAVARRRADQGFRRSQANRRRLHHRRRAAGRAGAGGDRRQGARHRQTRQSFHPTSRRRRCCRTTRSKRRPATGDMFRAAEGRWGSREVEITDVDFVGADGRGRPRLPLGRSHGRAHPHARAAPDRRLRRRHRHLQRRRGLLLRHQHLHRGADARNRSHGDVEAVFAIEALDLVEGTYKVDVAIHKLDGYPYDYHRLLYTFRVKSRAKDVGIYRPRHGWRFTGRRQILDPRHPRVPRPSDRDPRP